MPNEPCRIELFGGLRVRRNGRIIRRFRTQKTAALLAYLAYHRGDAHPREALIGLFWPKQEIEAGRASLSTALSSLRRQLEPSDIPGHTILRADRFAVGLSPSRVSTDVGDFESSVRAARKTDFDAERRARLETAIGLYQGRLLAGYHHEWIDLERARMDDVFHDAAASLIALYERRGDLSAALRVAHRAVCTDPLREDARRHLMRLMSAAGRPSDALRQYRLLEQILESKLGEVPSSPLQAAAREVERLVRSPVDPDYTT